MSAEGEHTIVVVDRDGREVTVAHLSLLRRPDIGAVEHLARLQLAARRQGGCIRVRGACAELTALLELVGLTELLEERAIAPGPVRVDLGPDAPARPCGGAAGGGRGVAGRGQPASASASASSR